MTGSPGAHSAMTGRIAVIGATGFVGGAALRWLRAHGHRAVALVPRPTKADVDADDARVFDFEAPGTFAAALAGCDRLFLLRPPHIGDVKRLVFPAIEAAAAAGVRRIVFLSVSGAESRSYLPHAKIEVRLQALAATSSVAVAILRPGFFAQNLLSAYREDIVDDDRLYVCANDGRVAFVDTDDLGDVAARALAFGILDGKAATLTGPAAIDFHQLAALLSEGLGRAIRYAPASLAGFFLHRVRHRGAGWMEAAIITALHAGLRRGDAATVDPALPGLLGRPATEVATVIQRHRAALTATPAL